MWQQRVNSDRKEGSNGLVAVGIDRDKGSKTALRWAVDNLLSRGQTVVLIHVKLKASLSISPSLSGPSTLSLPHPPSTKIITFAAGMQNIADGCDETTGRELDQQTKDLFLSFHCFCTRKDIQCKDVVLEDTDVVKAILEYVSNTTVENLVIGAASKNGILRRFKFTDIPGSLMKGAPDFCNVYVISKGKLSTSRPAPRPAPFNKHAANQSIKSDTIENSTHSVPNTRTQERTSSERPYSVQGESDSIRSPFTRRRANGMSYGELSLPETDISFVSSGRPSIDRTFPTIYEPQRASVSSDIDYPSSDYTGRISLELNPSHDFSYLSQENDPTSWPSKEETEAENRRLRLELKQTMDMYSTACKEALTAQQMTMELQRWKAAEEQRLAEARLAEETALAIAEKERAKSRAAIEHAEAAKRIAELEAQKRINAEMKALKEAEERRRAMNSLTGSEVRYRKYSIEEIESVTEFFSDARKIGEGGYGPVYKCFLDHTPVAIKVLRPDAAQGKSQFQQEVEVLSCIRHPNMVLLLGACPEYGCLVYEYMANGSLEDRLFRRGNTPPLSWQIRFRIAAEIGTGLLFLHQTKPEPLVHRDLKPANILLDRNFVSKISDVGLARLVPPSIADNVTQYRMTSTAGTFCYIDPEYQQTGMLGIKSDVYSLGIMLLQIITAKPPMGLTHHVERAIEKGNFTEMLDPTVPDWPVEEALSFARLALRCAELRRKDRPDLGKVVLPELNRLRALAEDHISQFSLVGSGGFSPNQSRFFSRQEVVSDTLPSSGCGSARSLSGTQC